MQHGFDTRIVTRRVRQPTLYLVVWYGVSLKVVPLGSVPFILADAILDRLVHNAHQLTLTGESMRKRKNSLTQKQDSE